MRICKSSKTLPKFVICCILATCVDMHNIDLKNGQKFLKNVKIDCYKASINQFSASHIVRSKISQNTVLSQYHGISNNNVERGIFCYTLCSVMLAYTDQYFTEKVCGHTVSTHYNDTHTYTMFKHCNLSWLFYYSS